MIAVNEVGESRPSLGSVIVKTLEELPSSPPHNIRAANTSATSILVKWDPPPTNSVNGELKGNNADFLSYIQLSFTRARVKELGKIMPHNEASLSPN